ncbi:MAG TPA: ribosome biogenesis GTPase YlqF [Candidatus Protoclostridium stercorigallinarum]|uniref:Ribosome biogenesis GTPase A n=1 Tax=Candidatus Protoclostridium stercorigallinarum TaxID=2838741 RepID=A0A9D1TRQ6_9FIRM|nr:ribosome biogenesis GTPase YlqF [Candidatus Protoclostridium stercorigallinarum]
MIINWFPGHMNRSLREMEEKIRLVDAVVYVLDSRAPFSCINPELDRISEGKPVVYVLNKADLVEAADLSCWIARLSGSGKYALKLDSTATNASKVLAEKLREVCADKIAKKKARGINAVIRAMVIGVPNSGKSTLINNLCGKAKTLTGNKAGVTRGQQWVRVTPYLEVLDTPGTLYPKLDDRTVALDLAFIGSIRDEVLDMYGLAAELVKKLAPSGAIERRYGVVPSADEHETLTDIARARGFLVKGGETDDERAAYAVIDDFRKGRMGKIILEKA